MSENITPTQDENSDEKGSPKLSALSQRLRHCSEQLDHQRLLASHRDKNIDGEILVFGQNTNQSSESTPDAITQSPAAESNTDGPANLSADHNPSQGTLEPVVGAVIPPETADEIAGRMKTHQEHPGGRVGGSVAAKDLSQGPVLLRALDSQPESAVTSQAGFGPIPVSNSLREGRVYDPRERADLEGMPPSLPADMLVDESGK